MSKNKSNKEKATKKNSLVKKAKKKVEKKQKGKRKIGKKNSIAKEPPVEKKSQSQPLKTPFTIVTIIVSVGAIIVIALIILSQLSEKDTLSSPPVAHKLSKITNEATFSTVKNSLFENIPPKNKHDNICLSEKWPSKQKQNVVQAYDKFLIILKRGKLFITNTTTNKFVTSIEISPIPKKENGAITYKNLFFNKDSIIVTGYRTERKSLEISTFSLTSSGNISRKSTYDIPTHNCDSVTVSIDNDALTFYTSRPLDSSTTLQNINSIASWSPNSGVFLVTPPKSSYVFYDNASLLEEPFIHTLTTCQLKEQYLTNCQQQHLIDNVATGSVLNKKDFYLWTTQLPTTDTPKRIIPTSKLYQFNFTRQTINMLQVEGIPIAEKAIAINKNKLTATIYQNNLHPPVWQNDFTLGRMAKFKIDLAEFIEKGGFINSSDDYVLTTHSFANVKTASEKIISSTPDLITFNKLNSRLTIYTNPKKTFPLTDATLTIKKMPNTDNLLIISKSNDFITLKHINIKTGEMSKSLTLRKNITTDVFSEISFLDSTKESLTASIALLEKSTNIGSIYLIKFFNGDLHILNETSFTKSQQRSNDGCQNDCQEDWQSNAGYFISNKLPNEHIIYSIFGSKLRKFSTDKYTNNILPIKTIDYTYRPAPPKPKRPRARIPGGAKVINGKYVCKKKHDYVGKSKSNNKGYLHLDMECCLDPDEYPNPWCTYRPGELGVTKLRYSDYHGRVKRKKK